MKTKLKIVFTFILIIIIFVGTYKVISTSSMLDYKKKTKLEIGKPGIVGDWELTLTNIQYKQNYNANKINIVITVNVKYMGKEETTYSPNYLLWQKDESKSPYQNIEWSDNIKGDYIFNYSEKQKILNATFEVDKAVIEDKDKWFMIVLAKDIKYIITE